MMALNEETKKDTIIQKTINNTKGLGEVLKLPPVKFKTLF